MLEVRDAALLDSASSGRARPVRQRRFSAIMGCTVLFCFVRARTLPPSCEASREICYYASISLLVRTFELS